MTPWQTRLLIRFYPRPWRDRYAAEFAALLETTPVTLANILNVLSSACCERLFPTQGDAMNEPTRQPITSPQISFAGITRQPSALVPLGMSLSALAAVLIHVAIYGIVHEADEGATAHIWQILMALQIPAVVFFVIKWLKRAPRPAVQFLALQAGAVAANLAAVFFLT